MAAVSSIAEDFDDQFLTCSICLNLYEDPKLLPCFHTFCRKCLEELTKKSGEKNFQCPLCRTNLQLPSPVWSGGVDKLSSNFYINNLLDFRRLRQSKTSRVLCQMCNSGTQAAAVCGDCVKMLCNNCVSAHRNISVLQDHVIIDKYDLENPTMRSQYARQIYCPRHPGQRTTFYCEPCATLVCRDCTVDEHRWEPGGKHDPREVEKVAPKYRAAVEGLMQQTKAVVSKINQQVETLEKELTATAENCDQEKKNIQQHYKNLISKLQQEEQEMITKVERVRKNRKDELIHEKQEMNRELHKTSEGLSFCQNILHRDNKTELLSLRQQMERRLKQLASQQTGNRTLEGRTRVAFQPTSLSQVSGGSLSVHVFAEFSIDVQEPAVESLPCSVTVTTNTADLTGGDVTPQIEVTSPHDEITLIQTTAHSSPPLAAGKGQTSRVRRVWGGEWRPQESGIHTLGVCMGGNKDLGSLTVDVGSNNPVLRFGQKGSQQGQFDCPIGVAVRGDRLYVADTYNQRVQVFDLSGKFCHSFSTTTNPAGLAVQTDGTIVVKSGREVKKFSSSGKLLHKFPLGEYCTDPYGLAVQRDGRVVVADKFEHSIFLFEADGTLVKQVGEQGEGEGEDRDDDEDGEGQFDEPCYVCVDKEDNIIVADKNNHCVQVFDKSLNFKHKFLLLGKGDSEVYAPLGVSADSRGNIVLANVGYGTDLQVFRLDGMWVSAISSDGDYLPHPHGVAVTEDGHVLSEEDVRNLRSILAREGLGQGRVEQATPHEMFNMLEADNRINTGNLGFLVQVLRSLKKGKLAEEAEQLEQEQRREGGKLHGPKEVDKSAAEKYKASVQTAISKITQKVENLDKEITATSENCEQVEKEIQQHYKRLISKLQLEEQEMITKIQKVKRDMGRELAQEKRKLETELGKTKEVEIFVQKMLDCKDDKKSLILRQGIEEKFKALSLQETDYMSLEGPTKVTFQPCSLFYVSGGSLSVFAGFSIDVEEPAVESLPCSVTVTTNTADLTGGDITPQIEVTSPQGKTTLIQTTAHSSPPLAAGKGQTSRVRRVWGGVWRPQESGKHTLGVCMGGKKDLGSLTVDVGSNNPVLRFGQKGSQQGQFDEPIDVAVGGDRLYVADTDNQRVQVFDLSGKFCHSFSTTTNPGLVVTVAVQIDGTVVVRSGKEVKKFSPSGKLLHTFPLGEYCTQSYGLAVQRDGRVVVADPGKHNIFLFEADGTLVKQVGRQGKGEGQFNGPYFVCVDKEDNIIVADKNNHRVQVFDKNLNFKHKFGQFGRQPQDMWAPHGVSADSRGNIVLANIVGTIDGVGQGKKLQVFCPNGIWASTITTVEDKLNRPHGVAVTEDGHVFVADTGDNCIRKYRYM
ncbi:uncharacterized protein LOC144861568 [Branchiostoma floridae x Branchiostoma japonicum]